MKSRRGFTLLELVIALVILATLTLFSSQSIQQALKTKLKIQEQIDDMSKVRDALRIMERDVNLAFHYRDLEKEFQDELKKAQGSTGPTAPPPGAPIPQAQPANPYRVDPTTQFYGTDQEMDFLTLNSNRMNEDQAQADFVKVGYSLASCQKPGANKSGSCLLRRLSPIGEGDVTKGGVTTVLLEGVAEFKLRYIGLGKQDWVSDWNTKGTDGSAQGNFPEAVEISLTTERGEGKAKKKISMQIVVPLRFPNNKATTGGS